VKVLLDTQCWLWLCASPERFSRATLDRLSDPDTVRLLSAASVWEMVIKHAIGKLPLPSAPRDFIPSRLELTQTSMLAVSGEHALRIADLPNHHRDPFDRLIVAQSLVEGVPVLTADRVVRRYGIEHLRP